MKQLKNIFFKGLSLPFTVQSVEKSCSFVKVRFDPLGYVNRGCESGEDVAERL